MQIMTDSNNLKTIESKLQMQPADYTQAQNFNQKQFNSMFANVLGTTSVSTDEEDCNELPPPTKKLRTNESSSNTAQQPSLQDLATFSIRKRKNLPISAEHCDIAAATSTIKINAVKQEVENVEANLLSDHPATNNHFTSNGNNNHQQQYDLKESHAQYSQSSTTTTSTAQISSSNLPESMPPAHALAMLKMNDTVLYIKDRVTVIGRNSTTSKVHFHVANSSFVSRKHFQIDFDLDSVEFFLTCGSKNGIFVDDDLQRCNAPPKKLPKSCAFRFPSTELLIHFDNFVHKNPPSRRQKDGNLLVPLKTELPTIATFNVVHLTDYMDSCPTPSCSSTTADGSALHKSIVSDQSNEVYSTLKISIPNLEAHSNPYPSPTGTISAANSCPASPRHSFADYQTFCGNGKRNSLNNDDPFRPPSTLSYNETEKPPYSYAQLIIQSISSAPDKQLTLSGIYTFISKNYPYYRMEANKGWQNSIRHNLSLNRYFIKVARSQDEPGKGSFWRIDPNSEAKLIDSSFKTRRQRSVVSFKRPLQGMPHSAPVSPSQRDMSRENSPLQDLMLQSEPGSPEITIIKEESYDDEQSTEELECVQSTDNQHK